MERRVVVTAIGIASPIGIGKSSFLENCKRGKIGISKCKVFSTEKLRTDYFGCIDDDNLPYLPEKAEDESRAECISKLAANELLSEIGNFNKDLCNKETCFCFGTLLGHTLHGLSWAKTEDSDFLLHSYDFIYKVRDMFGIKGGSYTASSSCASGTTAAGMAFEFIRCGSYERAIIGGVDPISEISAYGFHSLKNLSTGICNPFDANRDGINIGEGSAFLLAETLESAKKRNAKIYGEIIGYGLNNDAYHITSPDPNGQGAYMSMKNALDDAGIKPNDIDYINAHGTGTVHNDIMECKAVSNLFGDNPPCLSSLKGQIGHCMGAGGALELAMLFLAMDNDLYMPEPSLKEKMPEGANIEIWSKAKKMKIKYALSNSFAFAGNTASIAVKKYDEH